MAFFVYYVFALAQANADTRAEALARDSDLAEFTPRVTSPGVGTGSALAVRQSCPPGKGICSGRWCCPFNSDCCRDQIGCCLPGTHCVVVNGFSGCCQNGRVCG